MRKIENWSGGEVKETILIFENEEEREHYFREGNRMINESQAKSLADLRGAYMANTVKAREVRSKNGKKAAIGVFDSINQSYKEELKKVHDLYARTRANLRIARETSLLESEIKETPPA